VQNLMSYSCSVITVSYKGNEIFHLSLSCQDLMWDRQMTDMAAKTEGSHTVSVRA